MEEAFEHIRASPVHGRNADYIAALRDRDVSRFAVSVVTQDGGQLSLGDVDEPFTIQSIGKPLGYLQAVSDRGTRAVRHHVECRSSQVPFNSPATVGVLGALVDAPQVNAARTLAQLMALKTPGSTSSLRTRLRAQGDMRPPNASTNFGALTATSLISAGTDTAPTTARGQADARVARVQALFESMASRGPADAGADPPAPCATIDPVVFSSEINDSAGNQTLARLVTIDQRRRAGFSSNEALDDMQAAEAAFHLTEAYTRICAISTNVGALAAAYATLANDGRNPFTGRQLASRRHVEGTLAHMALNGLYEPTCDFVDRTGFIAKSGVSGAMVAIDPLTKMTFAVYSSPLDAEGNSVRGLAFLEAMAESPAYRALRAAAVRPRVTNPRPSP